MSTSIRIQTKSNAGQHPAKDQELHGSREQQQEKRFYASSDPTYYNPLLRTVTLRVTSKCTSLSIRCRVSRPGRRKRNTEIQDKAKTIAKFPINPSSNRAADELNQLRRVRQKEEEEDELMKNVSSQTEKQERNGTFFNWEN